MRAAIASIRKELSGIFSPEETDSLIFLIFEKLMGYSRTRFLLAGDETLSGELLTEINQIVYRLKQHEPIQYILGGTEFYGLPFCTVPEVLIPRPETEELVDWIIRDHHLQAPVMLDVGTGTGCIAVALRKKIPDSTVIACDVSPVCIRTTKQNALQNSADIQVIEYDILTNTPAFEFPRLDVIVSNPPYVRESEKKRMEKNVLGFEPGLALFVPDDNPLLFYIRIADFAGIHLKHGGRLYFEINEAFGAECLAMLQGKGFSELRLKKDIHGKDRMIGCRWAQ